MRSGIVRRMTLVVVATIVIGATAVPAVEGRLPTATGYVNDFAGILDAAEEGQLHAMITTLEQKTGAELAVATVKSTAPEAIEAYAVRLFSSWGIGKKTKDNGVLVVMAVDDRAVRVEVGYGLEGVLTDARSRQVIETFMIPAFRQQQYGKGLIAGTAALVSLVAKAYDVEVTGQEQAVDEALRSSEGSDSVGALFFILMFILMLGILTLSGPSGLLYFLIGSSLGRGYRGGGSYGGGFRGGGFGGGFGGGLSGGGGATGRW